MTQPRLRGTMGLSIVPTSLLSRCSHRTTEVKALWRTYHMDIKAFRLSDFRPCVTVEKLPGSWFTKAIFNSVRQPEACQL